MPERLETASEPEIRKHNIWRQKVAKVLYAGVLFLGGTSCQYIPPHAHANSHERTVPKISFSHMSNLLEERPDWLKALAKHPNEESLNVFYQDGYYYAVGHHSMEDAESGWGMANSMAVERLESKPIEYPIMDLNGQHYIDDETKILYFVIRAKAKTSGVEDSMLVVDKK